MSEHERIRSLLAAHCGGELEPDRRLEVEAHLKTCPDCAATLADLETTLTLLRSTPKVEPPPWLTTRIMARVRDEAPSRAGWWRRLASPRNTWLPLEGLALLLVCVGGYFLALTMKPEMRTLVPQLRQTPAHAPEAGQPSAATPQTEPRQQTSPAPEKIAPAPQTPAPSATTLPAPAAARPASPESRALPAPRATEPAPLVPPSKETEYAPPPPMGERSSAPPGAAAPVQSMDRLESAGAAMENKTVKRTAKQEQERGGVVATRPIRLTLSVRDPATAETAIRQAIIRSTGLIPDELQPATGNRIVARILASRLPELSQRLKKLGELTGPRELSGVRGEILLEISW